MSSKTHRTGDKGQTRSCWHPVIVVAAVSLAVLASGCSRDGHQVGDKPRQKQLLIFAGAGLQPPVAELADVFGKQRGVDVLTDYAGAEALLSKIRLSKRGDIYVPGDNLYVDAAAEQGLILARQSICYFVPTILVQKGNPKGINQLRDLIRPGIRLGLGNPDYIPIGQKSKRIFEQCGILWSDVQANLKFQSATVNELCMQIQAKSLDAVIVWDAVAQYYTKHGDAIPIPPKLNVISTVDASVLASAGDRTLAEEFLGFIRSEPGRAILRNHHYRIDPPR